jgi:hypothetical protein
VADSKYLTKAAEFTVESHCISVRFVAIVKISVHEFFCSSINTTLGPKKSISTPPLTTVQNKTRRQQQGTQTSNSFFKIKLSKQLYGNNSMFPHYPFPDKDKIPGPCKCKNCINGYHTGCDCEYHEPRASNNKKRPHCGFPEPDRPTWHSCEMMYPFGKRRTNTTTTTGIKQLAPCGKSNLGYRD